MGEKLGGKGGKTEGKVTGKSWGEIVGKSGGKWGEKLVGKSGEKMGEKERKEGGRKGGPFVTSPELCVGSLHPPSLCYVLLFHVTERAGRAGEIREFITQFSFGLINANYKRASVRSW